jgi:NAD(P)H dehydrogenase (quinone)
MIDTVSVAVVYHSASGRTRSLAEAVMRGALAVEGTSGQIITVDEAVTPQGQASLSMASAIVFGSPTYMGSASASERVRPDAE